MLSLNEVASQWTRDNVCITIYSDRELSFHETLPNLKIKIKVLNSELISKVIKEGNDFFLILKPWVIRDCMRETKSSALFVDTDTFFIQDPQPLFEQINQERLILHLKEHRISIRPKIKRYVDKTTFSLLNGSTYNISPKTNMWNSGVIGVSYSQQHLIGEVIHLTKQISSDESWHVMEQFAFSYIFSNNQKVEPSDNFIFHYWFFRPAVYLLAHYFNRNDDKNLSHIRSLFEPHAVPQKIHYSELPTILAKIYKQDAIANPIIFSCLPLQSAVGILIKNEVLKNPTLILYIWYLQIKHFFHLETLDTD